jgi:hypothetical protein
MPTFSIPRPFKIYPNSDFWFENKPSGSPVLCPTKVSASGTLKRNSYQTDLWVSGTELELTEININLVVTSNSALELCNSLGQPPCQRGTVDTSFA